ncbi:MAG: class I SAM-dependent methyltransferase [Acidimicrobiales bacterium]
MERDELRATVAQYGWYHTIDLGDGVVTAGMFDHRGTESQHMLPDDLEGLRCLDVATMDGYWAFAMERRGASRVVALDLTDPEKLDWPASLRHKIAKTMEETKGDRFGLVHDVLGSKVERVSSSVYDITADLGEFDVVFCGDLLTHLKDPITALERILTVCRGYTIVVNPIRRFPLYERRPMAQLDGVREFEWWATNLAGLRHMLYAAGFARVDTAKPFRLPATGGGPWKGLRGAVRGYAK